MGYIPNNLVDNLSLMLCIFSKLLLFLQPNNRNFLIQLKLALCMAYLLTFIQGNMVARLQTFCNCDYGSVMVFYN